MKIFFTGAIRGGRSHQPNYVAIVDILKKYGDVLSAHVADETITAYGETELSKEEIRDREMAVLEQCDTVVAEVTAPSLGVGYLLAKATDLKKPILAFYFGKDSLKLSAMIKGDPAIKIYVYNKLEDLKNIIAKLF